MKIFLALLLLFCPLPGLADNAAGPAAGEPGATAPTKKAHPDLLRLEQELSRKLDDKKDGHVTPEQYQAWKGEFRARLDAAITRVPPSPDNTAANARIMAQLGEGEAAHAALDQALEQNPKSPVLLTTKGQVLFNQKDFPGAAHNALQAWENSGRTDKGAWALYQMSKGRGTPSGTASAAPGLSPLPQDSSVVSADDSNKPFKLAVKGSALPSAVPIPVQHGGDPIKHGGGLPLWPLAVPFAGGLIAYGLYRAKQNDGGSAFPVDEKKTAFMPAAVVTSGPAAEVINGALRKGARKAATSAIGAGTITAATFGLIVGTGVATIYGLNQMIEAQDKYNEAIDTHRDDQPRPVRLAPIKNKSGPSSSPDKFDVRIAQAPFPSYRAIGDIENDCVPGIRLVEPSRSVPGGASIEQEYICKDGIHTRHTIIDRNGKTVHDHFRPGPPKGAGGD